MLHNIPEEWKSHLRSASAPKSRINPLAEMYEDQSQQSLVPLNKTSTK